MNLAMSTGPYFFCSGCRVEVARALINLHYSSEGTTKHRRIQSLVKTGAKPVDIPKPPEPRPTGPVVGVPKDAAPTTAVATPSLAAGAEEGEIVVGETLLSLRGGDFPGGVSALPLDREVDVLEGLGFDEAGKLRFLGFVNPWFVCDLRGSLFLFPSQLSLRR